MIARIVTTALCAVLCAGPAVAQATSGPAWPTVAPKHIVGLRYPRLANLAVIQGRVELQAVVSPDGDVQQINAVSGHPLLVGAAKDSLRQWRFGGCKSATECRVSVSFVFVLSKDLCDTSECPSDIQIDLPSTVTISSKPVGGMID